MQAGKHVLTEKLMAHNVAQCKVMGRVAEEAEACNWPSAINGITACCTTTPSNLIRWGLLGEMHHIRAQWHRGNLPGNDSWQQPLPGGDAGVERQKKDDQLVAERTQGLRESIAAKRIADPPAVLQRRRRSPSGEAWDEDKESKRRELWLRRLHARRRPQASRRWKNCVVGGLWDRTGGGLMAELGSHQLDAASIFISARSRQDGKKAHPLSVHAIGGRHIFPLDRDAEDHVYCMFEFPGPGYEPSFDVGYYDPVHELSRSEDGHPNYEQDPNKKIVVTYSSIRATAWAATAKSVMGTKGTLMLEREQEVMLYKDSDTSTKVGVKDDKGGPTMDTQASGKAAAARQGRRRLPARSAAATPKRSSTGPGAFATIRRKTSRVAGRSRPGRCGHRPRPAMSPSTTSIKGKGGYIEFQEDWYDIDNDATPDGSSVKRRSGEVRR